MTLGCLAAYRRYGIGELYQNIDRNEDFIENFNKKTALFYSRQENAGTHAEPL
jgi:hypothetical protein